MTRFKHAFQGFLILLNKDRNFLYHIIFGLIIFVIALILQLNTVEWIWILAAIFSVWITETINTAIEFTVDLITKDYQLLAQYAKDVAAFSVLLSALFALCVGLIIFLPKIIRLGEIYGIY